MAVPLSNAQKARRGLLPTQTFSGSTFARPGVVPKPGQDFRLPKTPAAKQPYNWAGAANVDWFPGLKGMAPGSLDFTKLTGGYNPQVNVGGGGYADMIGGDYGVQEMESMMNARRGRAEGDFRGQIRQALIDLGVVDKSKLGSLGSYIDADTISKAAENKYSQTAKIAQAETARRAQSEADLAARGMLSSGQLTTNAENILAEGESSRYGALRDFLGAGQQGLTQLADLNDQLAMGLAQARAEAAARAAETYQYGMTDPYGYGPDNPMGMAAPMSAGAGARQPLSRSAWMARHPSGVYQNYLRAFQRHQRQGY